MRKIWRKDGSSIAVTATEADASGSPIISLQEHDPRLLAFLTQNMAAAIAAALLADVDDRLFSEDAENTNE